MISQQNAQLKSILPLNSIAQFEQLRSRLDSGEYDNAISRLSPLFSPNAITARTVARDFLSRLAINELSRPIDIVDKCGFAIACDLSTSTLDRYATLHEPHISDIENLIHLIEKYIDDRSITRPLNFLMLASPGAGKSHFIECVARRLKGKNVAVTTFNMASMSSSDDLAKPLDEARNTKVEDKLPLLFLDEFDASPSNFGLLLPLLWDGAVTMRHTDLRLGKIIIVLAGSSQTIPDALGHAKSMRTTIQLPQGTNPKLIDLFSRINGSVVRIPLFYDPSHSVDRRTDKVLVAIQLLRLRFGSSLRLVSLALLRLIAKLTFRYDVRSIAHLINELPNALGEIDALTWKESRLPMSTPDELRNSSLVYHLVDDENNAHGVVDIWSKVGECSDMVPMPFPVPRIQEGDAGARMAVASMIAQVEAIISSVNAVPAGKENDV